MFDLENVIGKYGEKVSGWGGYSCAAGSDQNDIRDTKFG
jgi:hypothetical protein